MPIVKHLKTAFKKVSCAFHMSSSVEILMIGNPFHSDDPVQLDTMTTPKWMPAKIKCTNFYTGISLFWNLITTVVTDDGRTGNVEYYENDEYLLSNIINIYKDAASQNILDWYPGVDEHGDWRIEFDKTQSSTLVIQFHDASIRCIKFNSKHERDQTLQSLKSLLNLDNNINNDQLPQISSFRHGRSISVTRAVDDELNYHHDD